MIILVDILFVTRYMDSLLDSLYVTFYLWNMFIFGNHVEFDFYWRESISLWLELVVSIAVINAEAYVVLSVIGSIHRR